MQVKKIGIQGSFVGDLSEVYIDEATAYEDLIGNKKESYRNSK
ncbi:hypothetical protein [Paenibacillus sp. DMB20]|nr:hypothetical protein [Paenibacillus sp. DMB20]